MVVREFSGALVREKRQQAGLRPEHVAVKIERSAFVIYQYETDRTCPPAPILGRLADLFDCSVDDFYARKAAA